jgi:hypothetical protein
MRDGARSSENVPRTFWKLTGGSDFSTIEGLYALVREKIYLPMLSGNHKASKAAMKAILAGFENGEPGFAKDHRERLIQRDLILRDSTFCLYRMSDNAEHTYAARMRRLLKDDADRPLLMDGVLTYELFADPSVEIVQQQSAFWLENTNADWQLGPQAEFARLVAPAIRAGCQLDAKLDYLGDRSPKDAINTVCDDLGGNGWLFESDICRTNLLEWYALQGDLEWVAESLAKFHERAHVRAFIPPHLVASLLVIEAQVNFSASKGKKGNALYQAGRKVREVAMLREKYPKTVLRKDRLRLMEEIHRVTVAEYGGDGHMRV